LQCITKYLTLPIITLPHNIWIFTALLYVSAAYAVVVCPRVCVSVCLSQDGIVPNGYT